MNKLNEYHNRQTATLDSLYIVNDSITKTIKEKEVYVDNLYKQNEVVER